MHRSSWLVVVLVMSVGCGIAPSPRRGSSGESSGGSQWTTGTDPREILERLDGHLRQEGFAPLGPAVRNPDLRENGVVAYSIDAEPGQCFVAAALGHSKADLNMVLLDPFGRSVGYNVQADPHPWVKHCATQYGRFTARVQMVKGSGEYYYVAYGGPSGASPRLARFFGGEESTVRRAELDSGTAQRLEALDRELDGDRYERVEEARGVVLDQGQDRNFPLNLTGGTCYAFATLAGPGVKDTDVAVVDGSGNELARDAEDDRDGLVRFCAPSSGSYTLRARPYEGQGAVFVAGYVKQPPEEQEPTAPSPPSQPLIEEESEAAAGLEENFRLLDADMQARGYRGHGDSTRDRLEEGQARDLDIQLEGGKCYAILAVGDNGVRNLDLILRNARGQPLDRDMEEDARPVVRVCPERSGDFTMRVQMVRGSGEFVYSAYRWPRGTSGPFGLRGLIYVRLAEVTSLLQNEGYAPSPDYTPEKGQLRKEGARTTHRIELEGGRCYTLLAVGGQGVSDLDVELAEGGTRVGADATRNAFPSVRHCPDEDGEYAVQIMAKRGSGEYFYQVFTQQK